MRKLKYIFSTFIVLFIVSCANDDSSVANDSGPIYKGPYYNCLLYTSPSPRDQR